MIVGFCAFTLAAAALVGLFVYHVVDARLSRSSRGRSRSRGSTRSGGYSSYGRPTPGATPDAPYSGVVVPSYPLDLSQVDPVSSAAAAATGKQAVDALATKQRRAAVREAMAYSWQAYSRTCFGKDELLPMSQQCSDWVGMGLTLVDSLDTLWIMGMKDEFARARQWVDEHLLFHEVRRTISVFETIIRVVGGLLSAFDLSNDAMFLVKAKQLTDRLLHGFHQETGIPYHEMDMQTFTPSNPAWTGMASLLSEVGTLQVEFSYLSYHLQDPKYYLAAQRITDVIERQRDRTPEPGLYPTYIHPQSGEFKNRQLSFGALGDSFYEYLLKQWIITGRTDEQYRRMYVEAVDGMMKKLVHRTETGTVFVGQTGYGDDVEYKMEHLTCFVPGMLALGVYTRAVDDTRAVHHMALAEQLMDTCAKMYSSTGTGVGPEATRFFGPRFDAAESPGYYLRPEVVESVFIMWRITHNQRYREMGWTIFAALNTHCRLDGGRGFTGLEDVNTGRKNNKMESFWLAETLKYLYLLFSPDTLVPLDRYVFNTEAHPLQAIPNWDDPKLRRTEDGWRQIAERQRAAYEAQTR